MTRYFLLAAALFSFSSAGSARDWVKYPAVTQIENADEIFAIGDAHSDVNRLARVMVAAGIIDSSHHWRAGHAVLVTTGDMIDKGPRALDVLRLLIAERADARRAGGDVVILAGNHEAEFLADPGVPTGQEFAKQLKAARIDPHEVGSCKGEIGEFLCSLSFAARVGDWFFSHGGNTGGRTVAKLTADLQGGVDHDGYRTKHLIGDDSILESRLNGDGRAVWMDAGLPDRGERDLLADYARALGVAHIVEGHVPSPVAFADDVTRNRGEMFQRFGLLFLIDTGMSEGVDSSGGAVLHITRGGGDEKAVAICPDGTKSPLWDNHKKQDIGRAAPCSR